MSSATEQAILRAAAEVLERGGPAALTTRAVCEAAGVKSPTLYHHFGDKDGLARALVRQGLAEFLAGRRPVQESDHPLEQLRSGWDQAVEFALQRPALHALYLGQLRSHPHLADEAYSLLQARVQRLVDHGIFQVGVEEASRALWAACNGVLAVTDSFRSKREALATSALLFDAVVGRLSRRG